MKLISNNLKGRVPFPKDAVVRVNSAWVKSAKDLEKILRDNEDSEVFLDYPSGRTKPPKPVLDLVDLILAATKHQNVKHFAVSNAENKEFLEHILKRLPDHTSLVPKIETLNGIRNIESIIKASRCKRVMLDREDLYLNCGTDTRLYENSIGILKDKCGELGVKVLELNGVYFDE
jgi:citrate lyase beta subunit